MGTVRLRIEELNTEEHANKSNTTKSQGREQSSGCPMLPKLHTASEVCSVLSKWVVLRQRWVSLACFRINGLETYLENPRSR